MGAAGTVGGADVKAEPDELKSLGGRGDAKASAGQIQDARATILLKVVGGFKFSGIYEIDKPARDRFGKTSSLDNRGQGAAGSGQVRVFFQRCRGDVIDGFLIEYAPFGIVKTKGIRARYGRLG